jgi:hypothetical protein
MQPAASLSGATHHASWRISREGSVVAVVDVRHEGGQIVVSAGPAQSQRPHSFGSIQAADAFMADLLASFSYLGCEVAKV